MSATSLRNGLKCCPQNYWNAISAKSEGSDIYDDDEEDLDIDDVREEKCFETEPMYIYHIGDDELQMFGALKKVQVDDW